MSGYAAAPDLAWVQASDVVPTDENVYLMLVPDGTPAILNGAGALVFVAAVSTPDPIATVAEWTGETPETIAEHASAFLDDLVARGWLVRT